MAPEEIDEIGLSAALRLATVRAVDAVKTPYHEIIIDGTINFLKETSKGRFVTTMPKADLLVPAVSAASIIAKVARDAYMEAQDEVYPGYGFASHVGYGTAKHAAALNNLGVTPLHRRSFAPIAKLLGGIKETTQLTRAHATSSNTTSIGNEAESLVVTQLESLGYRIIERNWKTKYCEIDVIAEANDTRYFVEVKYRSSLNQGGGVEAITPKKLQQMKFAAELYAQRHPTHKNQLLVAAIVNAKQAIELLEIS